MLLTAREAHQKTENAANPEGYEIKSGTSIQVASRTQTLNDLRSH